MFTSSTTTTVVSYVGHFKGLWYDEITNSISYFFDTFFQLVLKTFVCFINWQIHILCTSNIKSKHQKTKHFHGNYYFSQECKCPLGGLPTFIKILKFFKSSSQVPLVTLHEPMFAKVIFQGFCRFRIFLENLNLHKYHKFFHIRSLILAENEETFLLNHSTVFRLCPGTYSKN